jgi:HlyD family secretion protein
VPENDRLIIEARIKPTDIDVIHSGLLAKVALSAYRTRTTPQLTGRVLQVSADALTDAREPEGAASAVRSNARTYFLARIEIEPSDLARLKDVRLAPGMPVEVFVETGERTLIRYLMQPVIDSFRRAFREE